MKKASCKWVQGMQFVGRAESGHAIVVDAPPQAGGDDSAVRPGELTLIALGSCTGVDVVGMLQKMRVAFDSFEVSVEAEPADDHPKVWKKIRITYIVTGDVPEEKLRRAIELSQSTYCSVSAMLKKSADVTYDHEIRPSVSA